MSFWVALFLVMAAGVAHACTGSCTIASQIQYCSGTMKYCDGADWKDFPNASTGNNCSVAGQSIYQSSGMQYCNASNWLYMYCNSAPVTDGTCTDAGANAWDGTNKNYKFCNGTNWVKMLACGGGGGGGGSGSPAYCWGQSNSRFGSGLLPSNQTTPSALTSIATTDNFANVYKNPAQSTSCAIDANGEIWCWGKTSNSAGNGWEISDTIVSGPIQATRPAGVASWTKVSLGTNTSQACAIADTGGLYCWGTNSFAGLGNGSTTNNNPTTIVTTPVGVTSWKDVATGQYFACGIANNDQAYCWGQAASGRLGNGTTTPNTAAPGLVINPGAVTSWSQIRAGRTAGCGIANDNNVYCWGSITGIINIVSTPTLIARPGGVTSWTSMSLGEQHVCAIGNNGEAYCAGSGTSGQLGNGGSSNSATFVTVTRPGAVASWAAISAGSNHTCAIANTGNAYCWGVATYGSLGNGTTTPNLTAPGTMVTKPAGVSSWTKIATGLSSSCAVADNQKVYCWGYGGDGSIGNTRIVDQTTPVAIVMNFGMKTLDAGPDNASGTICGVGSNDYAYCWGTATTGRAGTQTSSGSYATVIPMITPTAVTSWTTVIAGTNHSCALASNGDLYCVGNGTSGQMGDGVASNNTTLDPVTKPGGVSSWKYGSAGENFMCAIANTDQLYCWGAAGNGRIGNGTTTPNVATPGLVALPTGVTSWKAVRAGYNYACAIANTDQLYCWGGAGSGRLGNGTTTPDVTAPAATPVALPSGVTGWTDVTAGYWSTCALANTGNIYCWGAAGNGNMGDGTGTTRSAPTVAVTKPGAVTSWTSVYSSDFGNCAIANTKNVYCWGPGSNGQMGNGTTTATNATPQLVTNPSGITQWSTMTGATSMFCGLAAP